MVIRPCSANSSLRSLARTSAVSMPSASSSVERLGEQRAARDGDRERGHSAARAPPSSAWCTPLDLERPADGRQRRARSAPAARRSGRRRRAGRRAPGRDLEDRARVVAEVAQQAEVEDHAVAARRAAAGRAPRAGPRRAPRRRRRAPRSRRAAAGRAQQALARRPAQPDLALQADEVARDELVQQARRASPGMPASASSVGYSAASPSPMR